MNIITDGDTLSFLWSALTVTPGTPDRYHAGRLAKRIAEKGWAFNSDVEDMLYWVEPRLNSHRFDIIAFSKSIGIHWENVCYRPNMKSNFVSEYDATRASGMALLLIVLERIGFHTAPPLLVDFLLPDLKSKHKKILTDDELEIFWLHKTRHKYEPITISTSEEFENEEPASSLKTASGYLISLYVDNNGNAAQIKIKSPNFRKQPAPVRTLCKDCGLEWYKGDPDSSQHHRKEHKKRMGYFDPQPSSQLLEERKTNNDPELVTYLSADWKHFEMYNRALAFKYEFHFDFVQWVREGALNGPRVQGFLLSDDSGAIIGSCSFSPPEKKIATDNGGSLTGFGSRLNTGAKGTLKKGGHHLKKDLVIFTLRHLFPITCARF